MIYAGDMETDLKRLDAVVDPEFIEGCSTWPMEKLRARRKEAEDLEAAISYARRIVQGRIDVYGLEKPSLSKGPAEDPLPSLKVAISARISSVDARIAYNDVSSGSLLPSLGEISALVGMDIEAIPSGPDEVTSVLSGLKAVEKSLSDCRRKLHLVIDALRQQLVLLYQSGELDVDEILGAGPGGDST